MGLARITCNISGLPIEDGDEVVVFLSTKINHPSSERMTCYVWDNYNVLRTPIYSLYNGVGVYPESSVNNNVSEIILESLRFNNPTLKIKDIDNAIEMSHEDGIFDGSDYPSLGLKKNPIIPIYVLKSAFDTVLKEFKVYGKFTFEQLINERFNEYFVEVLDTAKKVFKAHKINKVEKLSEDEKLEIFKTKRLLSFNEQVCFAPSMFLESPINDLLALNQNNTELLDYKEVIGEMVMSNRIDDLKEFLIENLKGIIITKFLGEVGKCWHEPVLFKCETHCLNIIKGMTDKYIEEYEEYDDYNIEL